MQFSIFIISFFSATNGTNGNNAEAEGEDVVTPWAVNAASEKGVDYEKLIGW